MTSADQLTQALSQVEVNDAFTEAVLHLEDETRLCFCHRVGERWAKSVGPEGQEQRQGTAGELLAAIRMFRLNRKHLDIQFQDGSRWDENIRGFTPSDT